MVQGICKRVGNTSTAHRVRAHAHLRWRGAKFGLDDMDGVPPFWRMAAEEYRAVHSSWSEITANSNLAEVFLAIGRLAAGTACAERALSLSREMNNLEMIGTSSMSLANAALQEEKYAEANQLAEEALRSHQQVGHDAHIANSLAVLAHCFQRKESH